MSIDESVDVGENGQFVIELRNRGAQEVLVGEVSVSCPCTSIDNAPNTVRGGDKASIVGHVDFSAAPPSVFIGFDVNGERTQVEVRILERRPKWNRVAVYEIGVEPGAQYTQIAGLYCDGSAAAVDEVLSTLKWDGDGIESCAWGPRVMREGEPERWFVPLGLTVSADAGPEPITGGVEAEGVRLPVALIVE